MKKLILLLLLVPLISFGQTKEELQLCLLAQTNSFSSDNEAENALDRILGVIGASKNFVLTPCSEINNAIATSYKGVRYILYDKAFMRLINSRINDWASLAILAHEVGHHINGHALDLTMYAGGVVEAASLEVQRKQELEADEFAGFILARLGATSDEALAFTKVFQEKDDTYDTHPTKSKRVASVTKGYTKAAGSSSVANNNSTPKEYIRDNENMSAEEYFDMGTKSYDKKIYSEALVYYNKAIEINPSFEWAILHRAEVKGYLKDFIGGIDDYSRVIEFGTPNHYYPYYQRGRMKKEINRLKSAVIDFNKAIELAPNFAKSYYQRGIVKNDLNDNEGALIDFNKAIDLNPKFSKAFINRGIEKFNLDDLNGACLDWNIAVNFGEEYPRELILLYCKNLNEPKESSSNITAEQYFNRGIEKTKSKDYYGAIEDYTRAIELDPDYSSYYNRANTKRKIGDYIGALADYTKAIELDLDDARVYNNRANVKRVLEDYYGAIADFTKAIELDPDYALAYYNRGLAKDILKDYYGAIADFTKAIELDPDYALAYSNRGIAKESLGDLRGACADWRMAASLGHTNSAKWVRDECN